MKTLVCGGRGYQDGQMLRAVLDNLRDRRGLSLLVHGDQWGADYLASAWAEKYGIDQAKFPANWTGRGKSAGPFRNQLMLDVAKPALVVAFPGGAGTADMVRRAYDAGIEVCRIKDY